MYSKFVLLTTPVTERETGANGSAYFIAEQALSLPLAVTKNHL